MARGRQDGTRGRWTALVVSGTGTMWPPAPPARCYAPVSSRGRGRVNPRMSRKTRRCRSWPNSFRPRMGAPMRVLLLAQPLAARRLPGALGSLAAARRAALTDSPTRCPPLVTGPARSVRSARWSFPCSPEADLSGPCLGRCDLGRRGGVAGSDARTVLPVLPAHQARPAG